MRTFLTLALALFMLSCAPEETTPLELAEKIIETYEKRSSLSYGVDYKMKFFSQVDDTVKVNASVDLIRIPEDTIFGGAVWIDSKDSILRYYDTSHIYVASIKNEKITRYKKEEDFAIKGNVTGGAMEIYFLEPEKLVRGAKDSSITTVVRATELDGIPVWHWVYIFDDDGDFTNQRKDIWFNKKDLSIVKMKFRADFQDETQYEEWNLSNVDFDKIEPEELKERFTAGTDNFTLEDYKPRSPEEREPLANGTTIPDVKGELYRTGDSVSLTDYRGKLLLLDFWYMDCFPCIKAIPHLNEMHHKYADRGLQVIGVDPFNNNEKDLKRMPGFLENNELDYPILFIDNEEPRAFKVFAYPTFYLVDREGNIVHSQIGHGENTGAELDSVIQANL